MAAKFDPVEQMFISYGMMDEVEKDEWSMEAAQDWVNDQRKYEISRGWVPHDYDTKDVYETILEFIKQDADELEE